MEYKLIRSKRKTMAIRITKEAKVEVRAPLKMLDHEIDRFISSKMDWIESNLEIMKRRWGEREEFSLNFGDMVLLRGAEYPIIAKGGNRGGFDGNCFYVPTNLNEDDIKLAIIKIYKILAKNTITEKVIKYSKIMDLLPTAVKINSATTRWGSCSGKNSINFSWRLVLAPDDVIDYVVVHELAHIKEHNHSDQFWAVVEAIIPDYKYKQQILKDLEDKLSKEDWTI